MDNISNLELAARFPQIFGKDLEPVIRCQAIDVTLSNTLGIVSFPDQPQLRNARIVGMELIPFYVLKRTAQLNKSNIEYVLDQETECDIVLNLFEGDLQIINNLPILCLNRMREQINVNDYTDGVPSNWHFSVYAASDYYKLNNRVISWTKCNLQARTLDGLFSSSKTVSFMVYYYDLNDLCALIEKQDEALRTVKGWQNQLNR